MSGAHDDLGDRVVALSAVPEESTLLFRVRDADGEEREAFLVRLPSGDGQGETAAGAQGGDEEAADGGSGPAGRPSDRPSVAAWINECQHFTHIGLDKGSGAPLRGEEVVCSNHGAMFEIDTGLCTYGPCEGAYLNGVDVRVEDGDVHLDDDGYEFVGMGPGEDDGDLTSTSNVEF